MNRTSHGVNCLTPQSVDMPRACPDRDPLSDVKVAMEEPAFFTGVAYACYVLTQGVLR